jgi:ABC-type dipeptide/oligopeptide/nickel transport system ATPase component
MNELLVVENLCVKLGGATVLDHVGFSVKAGECIAIVGESGSGKTTLGKAIVGLNPINTSLVEAGVILYKEKDLLKMNEINLRSYRGKEISMIFQDPLSALNPTMSVGNQVMESFLKHYPKLKKKQAQKKVIELFDWVGISNPEERFYQYPHQFSGGMRQRVVIAMALAPNPKILIADEPTSALDSTIQVQILDLLKKIQRELNMSILFITHDLNIALHFASRTLVMLNGKIVEDLKKGATPKHEYTTCLLGVSYA